MRPRSADSGYAAWLTVLLVAGGTAGCGSEGAVPDSPATATSLAPLGDTDPAASLAAKAAAGQDRRYTALYTLETPGREQRTIVVTVATDGTWRVDVPGGAHGGTADVAIAQVGPGQFQCSLPSALRPESSTCVQVAGLKDKIPRRYDPRIQHLFTDWLSVFTDRTAPLSISLAKPLDGAQGSCYAVESISASLTPPLDSGIYCYTDDGLLTAARVELGTLALSGAPASAPPSVDLPGPVVAGEPLGLAAPPPAPSTAAARTAKP